MNISKCTYIYISDYDTSIGKQAFRGNLKIKQAYMAYKSRLNIKLKFID